VIKCVIELAFNRRLNNAHSTIKSTNLYTNGAIKIIDRNANGHPNMKLGIHFCKKIFIDGVLINVITPLTKKAVLNDIRSAIIYTR